MKFFFGFLALVVLSASGYAQVGIGTNTPDPSASLDITSTTTGLLPPRLTAAQRDAITSPVAGLMLFCTNCGANGEMQLYNGTSWTNIDGSVTSTCGLAIGDNHQGGIIFYLDASGCHGLIAAPSDQSTGIEWSNGSNVDTYAYGNGIGAGEGNSQGIRRWQGTCSSCYASELCQDLSLGGYTDWYLPSKYELNLMYENIGQGNALGLGNIGNFGNEFYWSSTEANTNKAWDQTFNNGNQFSTNKSLETNVRAVRAF